MDIIRGVNNSRQQRCGREPAEVAGWHKVVPVHYRRQLICGGGEQSEARIAVSTRCIIRVPPEGWNVWM